MKHIHIYVQDNSNYYCLTHCNLNIAITFIWFFVIQYRQNTPMVTCLNYLQKKGVQYRGTINHKIQETKTKSVKKSKSVNKSML